MVINHLNHHKHITVQNLIPRDLLILDKTWIILSYSALWLDQAEFDLIWLNKQNKNIHLSVHDQLISTSGDLNQVVIQTMYCNIEHPFPIMSIEIFIFMQFLEKIDQIVGWHHPPTSPGKSWTLMSDHTMHSCESYTTKTNKNKSPPAWTQEAYCRPLSKCLLCCSV